MFHNNGKDKDKDPEEQKNNQGDKYDSYKKQSPKVVKPQESERISLSYNNITEQKKLAGETFTPIKGVVYLWVYTTTQEIIVGIEEPWKYPQAFIDVTDQKQMDNFRKIVKQTKSSGMLGHPTLACSFDEAGKALPEKGTAYIGGELKYIDGQWQIDNYSGRFGVLKNKATDVQHLMLDVIAKFEESMGFKPIFTLSLPQASHLKAYYKIWQSGKDDIDGAIKLLEDYTKSSDTIKLAVTFHWNRNNIDVVEKALQYFRDNQPQSVKEILDYFSSTLGHDTNPTGSLVRRLNFIAGQTGNTFEINKTGNSSAPTL